MDQTLSTSQSSKIHGGILISIIGLIFLLIGSLGIFINYDSKYIFFTLTTGLVFFIFGFNFITAENSLKRSNELMSEIITCLSIIEEKIEELKK
jgi:uncharacterized membrane protein